MYLFFCNRVPVQGVLKIIEIRILAAVARTFFCASRNAWGSHFLCFSEVPAHIRLVLYFGPKSFLVSSSFFKTPIVKLSIFMTMLFLCWNGDDFFHRNHENSFGVANSNMKTLARSKNDLLFYKNLISYNRNKGLVACKVSATVSFSRCSIYLNRFHLLPLHHLHLRRGVPPLGSLPCVPYTHTGRCILAKQHAFLLEFGLSVHSPRVACHCLRVVAFTVAASLRLMPSQW